MGIRRSIVKNTLSLTGSAGTGIIVANLITATTPPGTRLFARIAIMIGGAGLAGMLGEKVGVFIYDYVDAVADFGKAVKKDADDVITVVENAAKKADENMKAKSAASNG